MTVRLQVINVGNHPDDVVRLKRGDGRIYSLERGESVDFNKGGRFDHLDSIHGSGEECRTHEAMALCRDGPGDKIIRATFNPSGSSGVDRLKALAAALINEIDVQSKDGRLSALARTAAEEAAMWAVKSATAE